MKDLEATMENNRDHHKKYHLDTTQFRQKATTFFFPTEVKRLQEIFFAPSPRWLRKQRAVTPPVLPLVKSVILYI